MSAITVANTIRLERAALKRQLMTGQMRLAEALEQPALANALVMDVLLWLPDRRAKRKLDRRASTQAVQLFAHIQRSPLVRVHQLSPRERRILVYAHARRRP